MVNELFTGTLRNVEANGFLCEISIHLASANFMGLEQAVDEGGRNS